ncbi:J domain-containing protein [Pontibacter saemangeumensis]|uniref:J domain-containing protein n=1 Tax=Pontibacter saemangeumensis TaxID=1084525 RepID=A0ABP8M167_9BACT
MAEFENEGEMPDKNTSAKGLVPQITVQEKSPLSKLQRQFNSKIKKINTLKKNLAEREALVVQARARVETELRPIMGQLVEKRIELVKLLDRSYALTVFRKREKDKIALLIEDISYNLIEAHGVEELIPLHDKYAAMPHADAVKQAEEEAREMTQDIFRSVFGLEVEVDDFDQIEEQILQQLEEREKERSEKKSARKKTKAQLAKEEKRKAEMSNISKASRRVYTDLVKLLHPDKEQDEATRAWKEEAMKQITHAYKQDDFFELLRLRMEHIPEQDKNLDQLPEEQLKYYLKLLNEQVRDLEDQQYAFFSGPDASFYHQYCGNPKQMDQKFGTAKNDLKKELKQLKQDLQNLEEPAYLRAFLKELRFS